MQDQQLGTGHAVACGLTALPADFTGTVVVTLGDVPLLDADTLADLIAAHSSEAAAATVMTTTLPDPTGYGRILRTQDGEVIGIAEQADASPSQLAITEVNAGVYAFDITALRSALSRLSSNNAQQEQYVTDVIAIVHSDGQVVRAKHVDDAMLVAGVNDRVQLAALGAELNRRIVAAHQRAGVTITDPATTWIDVDVTIGRDTVVYPGTQLLGATRIGGHCQIGPDTTLTDVTVGDEAMVVRTHGSQSAIGGGAAVGPFAYLRPGTTLGADGKLGAFVETKNSTIGAGTKVPHLTYVGDADIGEHSNIGASSVFVNYDGETKSRTTIGSHVRTGSDTMFVAPVTIGDGAYTGAGTVVREDVPPGALAVSAGPAAKRRGLGGTQAARIAEAGDKAAARRAAGEQTEPGRRRKAVSRLPDVGDLATRTIEPISIPSNEGTVGTEWTDNRKNLMLFSGRAHPELAEQVAKELDVPVTAQTARDFANGEIFVRFDESVRGCDAFVLQSHPAPLNQWLMEQLLMIDALKRGSAKRITAILPFYPYARQDKKHRGREPISARLVADLLKTAGANRILTVDLHTDQIQGFFDGPVDHMRAQKLLTGYIAENYADHDMVVVSPDSGRVRVAEKWADALGGVPLAFIHKTRDPLVPNQVKSNRVVGDVKGKTCILTDDMIDTGGTIAGAVNLLRADGASDVIIAATHGVLSDPAAQRLADCGAREVIVTNTLPIGEEKRFPQLTVLSIAPLLANTIRAVFDNGSVTSLFDGSA